MALTKQAAEIWRAYATDGVPSSGAHKPLKSEVALWGTELESLMPAFVTPEFYGAVGDGTTDDRDALATALSSGSQVYLTRQYRIASNLTASSAALIFAGGSIIPDSGIAFGISGSGDLQVVPGSRIIDTSEGGVLRTNSTDLRGPALKISHYVPYDLTDDATEGLKLALKDLFTLNYYALDLEGRQVRVSSSLVMDVVTGSHDEGRMEAHSQRRDLSHRRLLDQLPDVDRHGDGGCYRRLRRGDGGINGGSGQGHGS
jgi:hypothetical protein